MNKTISHTLTDVEQRRLDEFLARKSAELLEKQRQNMTPEAFETLTLGGTTPYHGTIGGGLTYHLTPTSIGVGVSVTYGGETLDITDVDAW
jgi:hypothetical protein